MIGRLLAAHAAVAMAVGLLSAAVRGRPLRLSRGALDVLIALAIPVVGPLTVLITLALEVAFRRPDPRPAEIDASGAEPAPPRERDPLEELRIGTTVAPFAEVLALGDLEEVDRTLRRLADSDRPSVLRLLKDALQSPRLEVRLRVRGILVRVEDRLRTRARDGEDPLQRARASRKLADLSADPVTIRQHLRDAVRGFEESLVADPDGRACGELGHALLLLGEHERARDALSRHLAAHPDDRDARLARARANLRLSDVAAARLDGAALGVSGTE
jgi:hypothetical protein